MKKIIYSVLVVFGYLFMQGCAIQQHATTVERDKDNGCTIHLIIQLGVEGTDKDVDDIQTDLEDCLSKSCFIPCDTNTKEGCNIQTHIIAKKWSKIPESDRDKFHHIRMVDQDNLPSFVDSIGKANGAHSGGEWRRNASPRTYCHEVLHLCGLEDHYCSRLYDSVSRYLTIELTCIPPPDPWGGSCCNPRRVPYFRCSVPCSGHDSNLMATLDASLSCANMLEIVRKARLESCPEPCCPKLSDSIRTPPPVQESTIETGVSVFGGFAPIRTVDDFNPMNIEKESLNGFNVGVAAFVNYKITPSVKAQGRLRLFEYTQGSTTKTTGPDSTAYKTVITKETGYHFHNMGIDAMVQWQFHSLLYLIGGPSFSFNLFTKAKNYQTITSTIGGITTTIPYGDDSYMKIDKNFWNNNVTVGFNIGLMYQGFLGQNEIIQPYFISHIPFNSLLSYSPSPKNFKILPWSFDLGANIFFGGN